MRRALKRVGYVLVASALAGVLGASAGGPPAFGGVGGDSWPTAGNGIGNTRDATAEHIIGPGNVSRLTPAWSMATAGDVKLTPTVDDGVVYFPDQTDKLWAVSADSGHVLWSRPISSYTGLANDEARVSPAVYGNELLLGDSAYGDYDGAWVFAVDKNTGDLLWKTRVDDHIAAIITSAPVVYQGVAYLGVSSYEQGMPIIQPGYDCCTFRGSVVALDANTGRLLWKTHMVPAGYSGGSVWGSTPAIDPSTGLLYVGTGDNYSVPAGVCSVPDQTGCTEPPADDHFDSIVALDLRTGAIRWSLPTLSDDVYTEVCTIAGVTCGPDFDFGSGPNLIQLPSGRQLVGIGQKSGVYWAVDAATGALVWHTQVGPGSPSGGIQWGSATDGSHVFVALANLDGDSYQITSASGQVTTTSGGSWAELDAATGKILWQVAVPQQAVNTGYVTIANGVMYAGSIADSGTDMYALNETDGSILWSFASSEPLTSGPAVVDGTVYWGTGSDLASGCPGGVYPTEVCGHAQGGAVYAFRT